ncbi:MAG: glycosyltransferase, partial [Thermodesulfobacteriota bacterium]
MGTPKVSVVIPAYNHERYVGEAIESVLGQTFEDFELIIINDGSTDRTEDEILKFNDRRIRYYSQENRGLSATLNRGIELSRGEYFTFLPSDDVMLPEKLEVQLKVMEESKEIGIVFSYPIIIDGEGKEVLDDPIVDWFKTPFEKKEEIFPALFERNFLCAPTALIRQECFTKVGFFDEFLKTAQDYDMWMRILKYYDLKIIKTPLLKLRWHGANLTYRATEGTEMERAKVLMKAYRNLSLEEIFPNLKKLDVVAYYQACLRLSDYMENAGLPSLIPVAILYREMGEKFLKESQSSLKSFSLENRITTPLETFLRNKINILIETPSLDRGGMENVIFDFSKSLDKDLFKVVIVCVERGGELVQKCKEMGIPVEILMSNKSNGFREILDTYRIDIIISHHSTFGASISFDKGIPYIYTLHTLYTWFPEDILSYFIKNINYLYN